MAGTPSRRRPSGGTDPLDPGRPDPAGVEPETAEGPPILQVQDVSKTYPGASRPALSGLSLDVRAGQSIGIVGESGAGKTTLIRMLLGLLEPTSGRVLFEGGPLRLRDRRQVQRLRRAVQPVFQDPASSLDPRMRVGAIVGEPLDSLPGMGTRSERRQRVREVIRAVGLGEDALDRYPTEFSGGQRQRIAIARALAPRPRVVIADEPVSALDVTVRAQIVELLRDLRDGEGVVLVLVSHDLAIVSQLCDRAVVVRGGRQVEEGPVSRILASPRDAYTRRLIAAVPRLPDPSR